MSLGICMSNWIIDHLSVWMSDKIDLFKSI